MSSSFLDQFVESEDDIDVEEKELQQERSKEKSNMLKNQLDIYAGGAVDMSRKKKKKKKKKKKSIDEPDAEDRISSRKKQIEREREAKNMLKNRKKSKTAEEERRLSRQRKLEQLKREMEDSDDEGEPLLEKLTGRKSKSRRKGSKKGHDDDKPYSLTIWVYILFFIVGIERGIKVVMNNGNPQILAQGLGVLLIAGSFGVKVPQIAAILEAKTVQGLSLSKMYTGVVSLSLICIYHIARKTPPMDWGDAFSVLLQDVIIVSLAWKFSKTNPAEQAACLVALLGICGGVGYYASQPKNDISFLPILSTVIAHAGTIPAIFQNSQNQHTGPLSFVTQFMLTLGSLARVGTTLAAKKLDVIVLASFLSSVLIQGILLVQILVYWKNTKQVLARAQRKSKSQ